MHSAQMCFLTLRVDDVVESGTFFFILKQVNSCFKKINMTVTWKVCGRGDGAESGDSLKGCSWSSRCGWVWARDVE